jgi:hypothetical protein
MKVLGSKVKDEVTGFEGIGVSFTEWMYGCNRVGIESLALKDGKPIPPQYFDEQRVEILEEAKEPVALSKPGVKLGSIVRDRHTGFQGKAVGRTTFLYSSVHLHIEPQTLHEGKPIDVQSFEASRVELVEEMAPKVSVTSKAATGGPQSDPKPMSMPSRR